MQVRRAARDHSTKMTLCYSPKFGEFRPSTVIRVGFLRAGRSTNQQAQAMRTPFASGKAATALLKVCARSSCERGVGHSYCRVANDHRVCDEIFPRVSATAVL